MLLIALGAVPSPDGLLLGTVTSTAFSFGLLYDSYRIETSELPSDRYARINYRCLAGTLWCLAGTLRFSLVNFGFMRAIPPETTFQAASWVR